MWNFLDVLNLALDLNFVNYLAMAIVFNGLSLLVTMMIKGGNVD